MNCRKSVLTEAKWKVGNGFSILVTHAHWLRFKTSSFQIPTAAPFKFV